MPKVTKEEVIEAFKELRTVANVANRLHCSTKVVAAILDENGIERCKHSMPKCAPRKYNKTPSEHMLLAVEMYKAGASTKSIQDIGVQGSLYYWLDVLGVPRRQPTHRVRRITERICKECEEPCTPGEWFCCDACRRTFLDAVGPEVLGPLYCSLPRCKKPLSKVHKLYCCSNHMREHQASKPKVKAPPPSKSFKLPPMERRQYRRGQNSEAQDRAA